MANHHFASGSFKKELWINRKTVFAKPRGVDVEFISAGAFNWVFADSSGKEVRSYLHNNPAGGWTSIDFSSLGLYGGDYSIGFRNASPGEKHIKQGDVRT